MPARLTALSTRPEIEIRNQAESADKTYSIRFYRLMYRVDAFRGVLSEVLMKVAKFSRINRAL